MTAFPQELLVVIIGHSISALLMLIVGLFVLTRDYRRLENRLFFFLTISTFAYEIFYIIASLQTSYDAAYFWWSLNIVDVFIPMAVIHFILRVSGKDYAWRWFIRATYAFGFFILATAFLFPDAFLPNVLPKLYFFYYLNGGWLYGVMLILFLGFPVIAAANLLSAYRRSAGLDRKRLEYFILMLAVGYAIGSTNFFLVFDIPIDPVIGMFTGFYLLPVAYGIFAHDLLDIRIAVRRAFYYALAIGSAAAFLTALVVLDPILARAIPGLQLWVLPLLVVVVALMVFRLVFLQFNEGEHLKYEFITVATHKLRTPLTEIRWSVDELLKRQDIPSDAHEMLAQIDNANNRLIELTNALVEVSHTGQAVIIEKSPIEMRPLAEITLARFKAGIAGKHLTMTTDFGENVPKALGEPRQVSSMMDVLIENAIHYTPLGGSVVIRIGTDERGVRFSVADSGIGVAPEDRQRIFSGFFRGGMAREADTEGLGLGLSLVKNIAGRLGGTVGFDSVGPQKGSTFWFTLPKA